MRQLSPTLPPPSSLPASSDFDLTQLLQSVGDAASAVAAQAGLHIILSNPELSYNISLLSGSEHGLAYTITHASIFPIQSYSSNTFHPQILRRIISSAAFGDSLEISFSSVSSAKSSIFCAIEFTHRTTAKSIDFSNPIFQLGLSLIHASFSNPSSPPVSQKYILTVPLNSHNISQASITYSAEDEAIRQPFTNLRLGTEPSLPELNTFLDSLKAKKVALHARSSTPFAQSLTSNLTAWGMVITQIGSDDSIDERSSPNDLVSSQSIPELPSFIIIDDDIEELQRRTMQFRRLPQSTMSTKRPPLTHRPKSHRGSDTTIPSELNHPPAILYFTSLTNYKSVRDFVQSIESQSLQTNTYNPEVFALPKPVGPRRFLTALYTAANRPLLDPLFAPIATCPTTPPAYSSFTDTPPKKLDSRTRPDKLGGRSPREGVPVASQHPYPGSPLAQEMETAEYFPETDVQALGQTPSSGMLIQSPDGQPAGIFFKPPASQPSKYPSNNSNSNFKATERDFVYSQRTGPSMENLRMATRHLSDEILQAKSVSHPMAFLRSKTTSLLPASSAQETPAPSTPEVRRKISSAQASDSGSSRIESTREVPTARTFAEEDERMTTPNSSKHRVKSPRARPEMLDRKSLNSNTPKISENAIVPPINVLIVEGDILIRREAVRSCELN